MFRTRQAVSIRQSARSLHHHIIAKARAPELYRRGLLADTFEGRFHAIALYSALVFPALEQAGDRGKAVSAMLNDHLFDSFDAALREKGVGDASIARKVRKMGETLFGIGQALNAALASDRPTDAASAVLVRNGVTNDDESEMLVLQLLKDNERLRDIPPADLLDGKLSW